MKGQKAEETHLLQLLLKGDQLSLCLTFFCPLSQLLSGASYSSLLQSWSI